jgi:hypothetical protein
MPKFEKENSGKPKGAKNKFNTEIRGLVQKLFDDHYQTIQEDLEVLEPKDRLIFFSDLLPYLLPKLQSTTHTKEIALDSMTESDYKYKRRTRKDGIFWGDNYGGIRKGFFRSSLDSTQLLC